MNILLHHVLIFVFHAQFNLSILLIFELAIQYYNSYRKILSLYIYKINKHFIIIQRILFDTNTNKLGTSMRIQCA